MRNDVGSKPRSLRGNFFNLKHFPTTEEVGEGYAYFFSILGKTVSFTYV